MINRPDLIKWLRVQIELGKNNLYANVIQLVQKGQGTSAEEIEEWQRPFPEIKDLANKIEEAVNRHCVGSEDPITIYQVRPYFGDNTKPTGAYPIRIENINLSDPDTSSFLPEEGVHAKGLLAQTRRHLEGMWKLTAGSINESMRSLREQNLALLEDNRKLQEMQLENFRLQQELLDRKQDRQMSAMKAAASQRLKEKMLENLLPMLPLIINKIQGARVLPEVAHPDVEQFKMFLATIKEDEFPQLMGMFGPRLMPILDLIQKYKAEYEASEAEKQKVIESMMPQVPTLPSHDEEGGGGGLVPL
jgi:hypothetical protein